MIAVRATGLVKRYDDTCAVDGVDLEVCPGEVRGLLGPNGAGKTTFLRMLFGLVRPDRGTIELLGRPLRAPHLVALEGVAGFVEDPRFYPYLSGQANLELVCELDRRPGRRAIADALQRVGLADRADDRVGGYSTGMRQRLGIAAALVRSPRLLLLDEPTSGLDPAGARDVHALLRELASRGVAVVLSSHLIAEVEHACDAFTVLKQGRVVWSGGAASLRDQAPAGAYLLATSDDARALEMTGDDPEVRAIPRRQGGLALTADQRHLDAYTLALGQAGVAVRRLEMLYSPLESMFFSLTSDSPVDGSDALDALEPLERAVARA